MSTENQRLFQQLSALSDVDINSIGTSLMTPCAKLVVGLINDPAVGSSRLFWSCRDGRIMAEKHAQMDPSYKTDRDHPVIHALFQLHPPTLTSYALSRIFAEQARGIAFVFIGTDKPTEPCGFHIGNNFWEAELPVLQQLKQRGLVSKIIVVTSITGAGANSDLRFYRDLDRLYMFPLWRRIWHPTLDSEATRSSFVGHCKTQVDWDKWRATAPPRRHYITIGRLRHILRHWRQLAQLKTSTKTTKRNPFICIVY